VNERATGPLSPPKLFTHAECSRGGAVFTSVFLCVCLYVFPHDISKTTKAMIAKLDMEVFHNKSWVQGQKVKVTSHNNIAGVGLCTLVSASFFDSSSSRATGLLNPSLPTQTAVARVQFLPPFVCVPVCFARDHTSH